MMLYKITLEHFTPLSYHVDSVCFYLKLNVVFVYFQIDYPDVQVMKPGSRGGPCNTVNLDRLPPYDSQDDVRMRRMNSDTSGFSEQVNL